MPKSRIPELKGTTEQDAQEWFLAMRDAELLFDPNDDATEIVHRESNEPLFTHLEATEANAIVDRLSHSLGDKLDAVVYPIYMEALGHPPYPEDDDDSGTY